MSLWLLEVAHKKDEVRRIIATGSLATATWTRDSICVTKILASAVGVVETRKIVIIALFRCNRLALKDSGRYAETGEEAEAADSLD